VLLGRVEVQVLAVAGDVGAGDLAGGALAVEDRVLEDLAVGAAEAEHDPVQRAVALDARALAAEDPRLLVEPLGETKRSDAFWPTMSSKTTLTRPSAAESSCSQTSACAPSSRTTSTRQLAAVPCWAWMRFRTTGASRWVLRGT
jgi:hypothetical protein